MKISKLIVPMVALTVMSNNQVQVEATRAQCIQGCVAVHSLAAKARCAAVYFPPAFVACQLAASAALATCICLCNNPN